MFAFLRQLQLLLRQQIFLLWFFFLFKLNKMLLIWIFKRLRTTIKFYTWILITVGTSVYKAYYCGDCVSMQMQKGPWIMWELLKTSYIQVFLVSCRTTWHVQIQVSINKSGRKASSVQLENCVLWSYFSSCLLFCGIWGSAFLLSACYSVVLGRAIIYKD